MRLRYWSWVVCAALLSLFAWLAWSSAEQESPTIDEPVHTAAAYVRAHLADFRIDREQPPLFGQFAVLTQGHQQLQLDTASQQWRDTPEQMWLGNPWAVRMLFQTPGNDGDRLIRHSRIAFLILGIALSVVIAAWAWELGGPVAAVVAMLLYSLDPNFLAHAPLVKNDVPLALAMACLGWSLLHSCRRITIASTFAIALSCFMGAGFKFSGVLLVPFAAAVLFIRAMMPAPWIALRANLITRLSKSIAALFIILVAALIAWSGLWMSYGSRFSPTPDPSIRLDLESSAELARRYSAMIRTNHVPPTAADAQATPEPFAVPVVRWLDAHHLMPQAWCAGMMYTLASTLARPTYLLGEYGWKGWWYYFPLAVLFKTPIATLAAGLVALLVAISAKPWRTDRWRLAILCLIVPAGLYALMAMRSNIDIGLRHFLAVYPACYVAIGVVAARRWTWPRARIVTVLLSAALVFETLHAYPNYIPFFNIAAGGYRGGARLLADSNLDWGQDIKRLVAWQTAHPDVDLYVACVDSVDPRFYGLRFTPLEGNSNPPGNSPPPNAPGVLAVSVGLIQGMYGQPERNAMYAPLRDREPLEILGGSIYLYRLPLRD